MQENGKESAASEILRLVGQGLFEMTEHAFQRATTRGITRDQIIHCAQHCIRHRWQEGKGTYIFIGYLNSEKDAGGFAAVLREAVVIVTVFRRRLTKWEEKLGKPFLKP